METDLLPVKEQIDSLLNGEAQDLPLDSCQSMDLEFSLPPWFDKEKYKRGQNYIKRNIFAQYGVTLYGLVMVLSVPSILSILMASKKSATMKAAYRRYLSTIMHIYSWYNDDLKPGTKTWKSLIAVRSRHLRASKTSQRKGHQFISQRDLVLTQFGFYGFGLIRPRKLGMQPGTEEDIEGYIHFWRTIGYMMGIDDRFNLCRPSTNETMEITEAIGNEVFLPLMHNPPEYFLYMSIELLKAMTYIVPVTTAKTFFYFAYTLAGVPTFYTSEDRKKGIDKITNEEKTEFKTNKIISQVKMTKNGHTDQPLNGNEIYSTFNWYDRFTLWLLYLVHLSGLSYFLIRLYLNHQIKVIMFLVKYFPFLCFYRFGFRDSYVDMFAEDKPMDYTAKTNREMLEWFGISGTDNVKANNNNNLVKNKVAAR